MEKCEIQIIITHIIFIKSHKITTIMIDYQCCIVSLLVLSLFIHNKSNSFSTSEFVYRILFLAEIRGKIQKNSQ